MELDSHADTCVVGDSSTLVIHDFGRPVRVLGYDGELGEKQPCKTVSAVVAYDDPTGDTYMLVIHQAILVQRMKTILLSTSQVWDNGIRVNDEPKHMVPNPTDDHHCIQIPCTTPPHDISPTNTLKIPLAMTGVISFFPARKPTQVEYENCPLDCILSITAEEPEWDPSSTRFQEAEDNYFRNPHLIGSLYHTSAQLYPFPHSDLGAQLPTFPEPPADENDGYVRQIKAVSSGKCGSPLSAQSLTS